jgi:hypothetical protein
VTIGLGSARRARKDVRMAHQAVPVSGTNANRRERSIILRWIAIVSIGEALGFAVAAGVAIGTVALGIPDPWDIASS